MKPGITTLSLYSKNLELQKKSMKCQKIYYLMGNLSNFPKESQSDSH